LQCFLGGKSNVIAKAIFNSAEAYRLVHPDADALDCSFTVPEEEEPFLLWIDEDGNLFARDFIYADGRVLTDVSGWPYSPGGPMHYGN